MQVTPFPPGFHTEDIETDGVIKDSGHWVMEEQPAKTTAMIVAFIDNG
jgi:pimeloyl-ACP methyl ester carboxylesterase